MTKDCVPNWAGMAGAMFRNTALKVWHTPGTTFSTACMPRVDGPGPMAGKAFPDRDLALWRLWFKLGA